MKLKFTAVFIKESRISEWISVYVQYPNESEVNLYVPIPNRTNWCGIINNKYNKFHLKVSKATQWASKHNKSKTGLLYICTNFGIWRVNTIKSE